MTKPSRTHEIEYVTEFQRDEILRKRKLENAEKSTASPAGHKWFIYIWCRGWDLNPKASGDITRIPLFLLMSSL
jgi:hypothetical protein